MELHEAKYAKSEKQENSKGKKVALAAHQEKGEECRDCDEEMHAKGNCPKLRDIR